MNKTTIYSTIIASTIAVLAVFAFSLSEAEAKPPSRAICPAENVQHWGTFSLSPSGTMTHPTLPSIDGVSLLEVQVPSDQSYVVKEIVLAGLIELGYLDEISQPLDITDIGSVIPLGSSSIICAEN